MNLKLTSVGKDGLCFPKALVSPGTVALCGVLEAVINKEPAENAGWGWGGRRMCTVPLTSLSGTLRGYTRAERSPSLWSRFQMILTNVYTSWLRFSFD